MTSVTAFCETIGLWNWRGQCEFFRAFLLNCF